MSSWTPLHAPRTTRLLFYRSRSCTPHRYISTSQTTRKPTSTLTAPATTPARESASTLPPLARLPTKLLLRSLLLSTLMTSPIFLRPSLAALGVLASTKSPLLNPDTNPILNRFLRWTLYNHFCAGTNKTEVVEAVQRVKKMGFQGVILGYSKEVVLDSNNAYNHHPTTVPKSGRTKESKLIDEWKRGTLETLRMIGPGDFLGVKLTGAGPLSVKALQTRAPLPEVLSTALDEICTETSKQGSRLWLDAEQQLLQPGLDNWAIELMRKYNTPARDTPLIYNTIQAYLKGSKENIERHLTAAATEGWTLGVKLVRGAYIEHEERGLIHDSKEDTDRSYNGIAEMLICNQLPGGMNIKPGFPSTALFLATHNAPSATRAINLYQQRLESQQPTVTVLECGQIQGMADELSCELVQRYEAAVAAGVTGAPKTFKCLPWGTVVECMAYLYRRAIENRGAVERTDHMRAALARELRRRLGF